MIPSKENINSSSHRVERGSYIKDQPYRHGGVAIGSDVWIRAGASVLMNAEIGEGAVVSANSLVSGRIPPFAICAGVPAQVVRYRS